jgi:hypothetical protein
MATQYVQTMQGMLNMYKRFSFNATKACLILNEKDIVDVDNCLLVVSPQLSMETGEFYVLLYFIRTGDLIICFPCDPNVAYQEKAHIKYHAQNNALPELFATVLRGYRRPANGRNLVLRISIEDTRRTDLDHVSGPHMLVALVHIALMIAYQEQDNIRDMEAFDRAFQSLSNDYWLSVLHETADSLLMTHALMNMASSSLPSMTKESCVHV